MTRNNLIKAHNLLCTKINAIDEIAKRVYATKGDCEEVFACFQAREALYAQLEKVDAALASLTATKTTNLRQHEQFMHNARMANQQAMEDAQRAHMNAVTMHQQQQEIFNQQCMQNNLMFQQQCMQNFNMF